MEETKLEEAVDGLCTNRGQKKITAFICVQGQGVVATTLPAKSGERLSLIPVG